MRPAWLLPPTICAAACAAMVLIACGPDTPIGKPAGSNNFDDPDDPGQSGQNSSAPDASGDANGAPCTAPRDCPAAFVCAYPIADACGAAGRCLPFDTSACADAGLACACDNTPVTLCAPPGYAPKPIATLDACEAGSTDAASDAATE